MTWHGARRRSSLPRRRPTHLDRNIALVGCVIDGVERLSELPRGTTALGFYERPEQRIPIHSVRRASARRTR